MKSSGLPMICQSNGSRLKIGPSAKPSAGSVNAAAAMPPAPFVTAPMKRRLVTVSPSKAPGIPRSAVYFEDCLWRSAGIYLR